MGGVKFRESKILRRRKIRLLLTVVCRNNIRKKEKNSVGQEKFYFFIGATKSEIETFDAWEKLRPRESKLRWESESGWEELLTAEFWTRGVVGGAEGVF